MDYERSPSHGRFDARCVPKAHRSPYARTLLLIAIASVTGCRRAAFNEIYVENMAGEIRALEDRVYEYDSAYQSLEIENEELRRINEELRAKNRVLKSDASSDRSLLPVPLDRDRKPSTTNKPKQTVEPELNEPSVIDLSPPPLQPRSAVPKSSEPNLDVVPPSASPQPLPMPSGGESLLPPPKSNPGLPGTEDKKSSIQRPQAKDLVEDVQLPGGLIRSAQQPRLQEPSQTPPSTPPASVLPQPTLPKLTPGAILQGRIDLPIDPANDPAVIPASANIPVERKVTDQRMVEIAFHDTLCRGHNFDDQPGDDGLYLVLVPKNESGEPLQQIGKLTVVIEESIDESSHRIAAWNVTPDELQESLEPIGVSQGFHLSLPFQDVAPESNRVQVFLKYELADGRVLVNRKDISLRRPGHRQTTWTPR
ncbi:hypothetical protein VN12_13980 [Pirellula sp. SH-Sr6A]|uniref:hypothetical protein n=1 Tax=Pirellula sp. SH-Sr6A TaxID=1632865 RepID=UPI00078C620B|nr:hypothetical protein [Pirellula sp. SH-Sr6A]AMV33231.1 hypothetical protein VN12_13980 [Pirellula sp. SH-Sr6A]